MKFEKIVDFISFALLIIAIFILNIASRYAENIINGKKFVWSYFLIGLTISIIWTVILYKWKPTYFDGGEKRASAVLSQFFSIIILTIFLSIYQTYETGKKNIYYTEGVITNAGSNLWAGSDYVHLLINGREERFRPRKDEYEAFTKGDTLILTIGKGNTCYDIIYEFNKK